MKIKTGDMVLVRAGKDKGKKGKVLKAFPRHGLVLVEGVNILKRHQRPTKANQKGQIVDKTLPIPASRVMIVDPKSGKGTRVGYKIENGKKVRIARASGNAL